jgi:hypothetical protein
VSDQQDGRRGLRDERANEVEHARLDGRIEPGRRLVEDEQLRVLGECHRDDHSLLHATGELVRVAPHDALGVGDLDSLECGESTVACAPGILTKYGERLDDLRADLRRRVECCARVLVDHRGMLHAETAQVIA